MGRDLLAGSRRSGYDPQRGRRGFVQRGQSPRIALSIALLLGSTGSGCSLFFAKGPPERALPHESLRCTHNYVLPVVDGIIAGLQVGRTAFAISQDDDYYHRHNLPYSRTADIAVGAALTVLFATSMGVGIDRVSRCKEADASFSQGPHARHPVSGPVEWTPEGVHRGKSAARAEEDAEDEAAAQEQARARAAADAKAAGEAAARAKTNQKGESSGD